MKTATNTMNEKAARRGGPRRMGLVLFTLLWAAAAAVPAGAASAEPEPEEDRFALPVSVRICALGDMEHADEVHAGVFSPSVDGQVGVQRSITPGLAAGIPDDYAYGTAVIGDDHDVVSVGRDGVYVTADGAEHTLAAGDSLTIYFFPDPVTVKMYWCMEGRDGALRELTEQEALWWDEDQRLKDELSVPADHPVTVSQVSGCTVWTPYTLPKTSDNAEGYPLARYAFGPDGALTDDRGGLMLFDSETMYVKNTVYGLAVADNSDMEKCSYYTGKNAAIYVIYREQETTNPLIRSMDSLDISGYWGVLAGGLLLGGAAAVMGVLRGRREDEDP